MYLFVKICYSLGIVRFQVTIVSFPINEIENRLYNIKAASCYSLVLIKFRLTNIETGDFKIVLFIHLSV